MLETLVNKGFARVFNFKKTYALAYTDPVITEQINNPKTADNIVFYISMLGFSIIALAGLYTSKKFN